MDGGMFTTIDKKRLTKVVRIGVVGVATTLAIATLW
jgi:hypothetical protein